ncbi:MAG: DNA mismatch repair endonuclease MutL, partial [Oscillospiraceae bacterium]
MPHIQVMDKALADLIAAGEVVERPASVVKELVENAVDAGATQVTVEIRNGGSTYIRVTDNGCGVPKEEMATAFLRHATSKISSAADLDAIGTLGFRGEALAAIAAVARVQMLSKPKDQTMGYSYSIECSEAVEEGDAGCGDGTTVVVRDLFFFHPARYKYLKKDVAEGNAVQNAVEQQALGHPEVSFRFIRDEKQVFTTPGDGEPLAALHTLMPDEARDMLFVRPYGYPGLRVFGYVSRPTACRGSRASQHFFVNGRWVRSKRLTAALEKAYENQRMVGRFPAAVLYLDVALDKVDVNAHPAKTEVRFLQENDLFGCVFRAVGAELMMAADRPELTTAPTAAAPRSELAPAPQADPWALAHPTQEVVIPKG